MTKGELLKKVIDYKLDKIGIEDVEAAVERYSSAILQQTPCKTLLPLTDSEIEDEAEKRYGEKLEGQYHSARPIDKARFIKGAKWARDHKRQ